jgi:predicted nucleic acid-binding protein
MLLAPFKVVVDANVLYPFTLRDTILRAASKDLFQIYWSAQILDEFTRNLVASSRMTEEQSAHLRAMMGKSFPESSVTGYESLIAAMPNDPKDRHVAAVAVKVGAQVIVTMNLRDFSTLPENVEAHSPDQFLSDLFDLYPDILIGVLRAQAAALRKPPRSFTEIVTGLSKTVPDFAQAVSTRVAALG